MMIDYVYEGWLKWCCYFGGQVWIKLEVEDGNGEF